MSFFRLSIKEYIAFQNKNMLRIPIYFIEQNNPYKKITFKRKLYFNFTCDF